MVNPYMLHTGARPAPKTQVQLSQSQALKKFDKILAKNNNNLSGSFMNKNKSGKQFYDSSVKDDDDYDDDDGDEDSVFKNSRKIANKFLKKKTFENSFAAKQKNRSLDHSEDEEDQIDEDELEITANNETLPGKKYQNKQQKTPRSVSAASSVSSIYVRNHRRSPSKVKFYDDEDGSDAERSTILEDLLSRNLVLDINDLEAANLDESFSSKHQKSLKKQPKSPTNKRNESVASIVQEEDYSSLTPSIASPSLMDTNLILDINELENSINKRVKKEEEFMKQKIEKKTTRKSKLILERSSISISSDSKTADSETKSKRPDSHSSIQKSRSKNKKSKDKDKKKDKNLSKEKKKVSENKKQGKLSKPNKSKSSLISDYIDDEITSIATEIIATDNEGEDDIKTARSEISISNGSYTAKSTFKTSQKKQQAESHHSYSYDDFETDQDLTASKLFENSKRKKLSFSDFKRPQFAFTKAVNNAVTNDAQIQVDPNDLLKNSDLIRSVSFYNPSSLLLASISQFDRANLTDLNQITGYNMVNQAFNDLFKINLNFIKNFLASQRNMYEFEMQSIHPK